ncbi:Bug family tripartite tricarboxylate transporter substrate binding protein [Hydrogenophaga sp. BPS33]|uniref:Bug family tripartite tricarboxylate transporter substrate binding protein n=1 Tax=Hydrogenophaga sp. BPS33 TaxID=2651974 RepID=UPI0013201D16|nr:tripartite tricarboxylate transporter substrate binding protein [Hydrogenophaga sp. BPS33]QHE87415.1 tripartite tricarboxylate transporter substrate binding protein [Hydrogenophaga sp. BPS33]
MNFNASSFSRRTCLLALLVALPGAHVAAQSAWPNRPIRILVPAPAGGASDMIARTVAESVRKSTNQTVLVENKPGAGGIIAVESMLSVPRDGYTFVLSPNSLVTENPHSYKFRFDPFKDLAPVAEVASVPLVLVADPGLPLANIAEMVAYVKARPGKVSYASYSPGTLSHLKGMQFSKAAGLSMEHVGYKGSPPALQDLMGGQVQFMFDGLGTSLPLIKNNKVRALAITSAKRSPLLPDVPTLAEAGYPALSQIMGTTIWSTPDVPQDIREKFRQELLKAISTESVKSQLAALGMEAGNPSQTVPELEKALKKDNEHTGEVLRSINYKPG